MKALIVGAVLGTMLFTAAATPLPATAETATPYLFVSHDGMTFERTSATPLFQGTGGFFPGGTVTESIWVRNQAPAPGNLRMEITDAWTDDMEFARALTFTVSDARTATEKQEDGGTEIQRVTLEDVNLMAADTRRRGLPGPSVSIAPGETVRLNVSVTVDSSLDKNTRLKGAGFQLRLVLAGEGDVTTTIPPDGDLPPTGVEVQTRLLLGAAVMGTGIALLLWKRRKKYAMDKRAEPI